MRNIFLLILLSFVVSSCQSSVPSSCGVEVRAAFDVGSGSTKMKVAELNTCTNQVLKVLLDDQAKIDYREGVEKSGDQTLPDSTVQSGINAIKNLKEKAEKAGAKKFSGVATAAFRQAKNGDKVILQIREATGIPLRVISQNLEALIGFQAASVKVKKDPSEIISWDIGGGSQQIVAITDAQQASIYLGQLASVSFKNRVIQEVKRKNPKKVLSPVPLNKDQVLKSIAIASSEAQKTVPNDLQRRLAADQGHVIGIGGVLGKSVLKNVKTTGRVTLEDLKAAIAAKTGVAEKNPKDAYAATDFTNLLLVYGYMQALKIKSYQPYDVNLIDGLWFQPEFWLH